MRDECCKELDACEAELESPQVKALPPGMNLAFILAMVRLVRELLKNLPATASAASTGIFEDVRAFTAAIRAGDYLTALRLFLKLATAGVDLLLPQFTTA